MTKKLPWNIKFPGSFKAKNRLIFSSYLTIVLPIGRHFIETGKKSKAVRYFKAKVLDTHLSEEINQEIKQSIDSESIVFSDKSSSYVDIADFVELHITEKSDKQTTAETLK